MEELDQGINNLPNMGTEKVPNSAGVLVLGILSIVPGCLCYGLPGIVMGIIALSLASGANKLIKQYPGKYSESSIQLVKAGKICGVIGLTLSSLYLLILVGYLILFGTIAMSSASFNI
jgi:hypothetical protein